MRYWAAYGGALAFFAGLTAYAIVTSPDMVPVWWIVAIGVGYAGCALGGSLIAHRVQRIAFSSLPPSPSLSIVTGLIWPIGGLMMLTTCHSDLKERHGQHRQAETDPSDPGPLTATAARVGTSGTVTFGAGQSASVTLSPVSEINTGSRQELEVVRSDMPILAHRAARIVVRRDGLHFAAINDQFGTFDRDADATCDAAIADAYHSMMAYMAQLSPRQVAMLGDPKMMFKSHEAPAVSCQCGFYAVPADVEAMHSYGTVDLLVELSGTVIEHESGYRAGHQRVVEIRSEPCPYCRRAPTVAIFSEGACTGFRCADHQDGVAVAFCDLERVLGVPVTFEEP